MTSKSELKVGDIVRRVNGYGVGSFLDAGIVIAIDRRQIDMGDGVACVKWMDTTRGQGHWYPHQLQRVIKE